MRGRASRADERQGDLFGAPPAPAPAGREPARSRRPSLIDPPTAEPESATAFAARATEADLDELAAALDDDALAHLALASTRQLRRRLARAGGRQRPTKGRKRPGALDKAAARLAAEWAAGVEDDAW